MHVWEFTFENRACHSFYGFFGKTFYCCCFCELTFFLLFLRIVVAYLKTNNWACETVMHAWEANNVERGVVERVVQRRRLSLWAFVVPNIQVYSYEAHLCRFHFFFWFFQCCFCNDSFVRGCALHTRFGWKNMRSLQWHNCYFTRTITTKSVATCAKKYNKCFRLQVQK